MEVVNPSDDSETACLTNKPFIQNLHLTILLALQYVCTAYKIIPLTNPDDWVLPFSRVAAQFERGAEVKIVQVKSAARTELHQTKSRLELCKNLLFYQLVMLQKYSLRASECAC